MMVLMNAPKLTFWQQATLDRADRIAKKASKRSLPVMLKVTSAKDVALLEAHGWSVYSHSAPSYVSAERWWMTRA